MQLPHQFNKTNRKAQYADRNAVRKGNCLDFTIRLCGDGEHECRGIAGDAVKEAEGRQIALPSTVGPF